MKKIYEGAEAELFLTEFENKKAVLKKRKPKRYREKTLDDKIIKTRLKREAKLLQKTKTDFIVPEVFKVDLENKEILMEYLPFNSFKSVLKKHKEKIKILGKEIAKLHNRDIVHGDLTLENILFDEKQNKPAFIDFGLGFVSKRAEDFATDIFVFKETLLADFDKAIWNAFFESYKKEIKDKEILKRIERLEKRRKYA